jgi:pyrroloquinoline quinone biosynthesis protein B
LLAVFSHCDALFLDGTFWSETEMRDLEVSHSSAAEMDHLPISGEAGSLRKVASLQKSTCAYTHINNSNPILLPNSPERQTIEKLGVVLAADGLSVTL